MLQAALDVLSRFPHTRGGVPSDNFRYRLLLVFPTHVGVYLYIAVDQNQTQLFSPHTWGCTFIPGYVGFMAIVFPTHVGVYRSLKI